MKTGMLWFDKSKDDLATKIARAADYYRKKYGQLPTHCYIHPTMMPDQGVWTINIQLHLDESVLPNHFWLGCEEKL